LTRGPQYGKIDVYYDRSKVASFNSYNETIFPGGKVSLQNLETQDGTLPFRFVVPSKASNATNFHVGIDGFKLEPVRNWIGQWRFIGPFPNPRESDLLRYGLDTVYPPEKEDKQNAVYEGVYGIKSIRTNLLLVMRRPTSIHLKSRPYRYLLAVMTDPKSF
jgi:hypothetical protein